MSPAERAQHLIDTNNHMIIATADAAGTPWVSPVFYVVDDNYDFYWVSAKEATHSENIRQRAETPIVIFEAQPNVDAVYMSARASEVNDRDELSRAIPILQRKEQPDRWVVHDVTDVTDDSSWRIYRATPRTIETRKVATVGGRSVTVREHADFRRRERTE